MQIKHLLEHLTGLLAAALAILFVIGMVYCIAYLDSFPYARIQSTFVDVVNTAVNSSPGLILLVSVALLSVVASHFEKYAIARGWEKRTKKSRLTIFANAVFLTMIFFFFYILSGGLEALWTIMTAYGVTLSLIIIMAFPEKMSRWKFLPILILLPLVLALTTVAAVDRVRQVKECKLPQTTIYSQDGITNSVQLCPIMSLERGLLFYDKEDETTIFIPWAQLRQLTTPKPPSEGEQTVDQPAKESAPGPPPAAIPSTPPTAPGSGQPEGEAPPR